MPARRLPRKQSGGKPWILQEPEVAEPEPLHVTCPACGTQALLTDHACSHCGQVFYERRPGSAAKHKERLAPREPDPEVQEFASRMAHTEKWTRVACAIGGVLLALVGPWYVVNFGIIGGAMLAGAAVVCLIRAFGRPDADLSFVDSLGSWLPWRRRY
jgi:hypothetical protein